MLNGSFASVTPYVNYKFSANLSDTGVVADLDDSATLCDIQNCGSAGLASGSSSSCTPLQRKN